MIILKKNNDYFSFVIGKSSVPIEESLIPYLSDDIQFENGVTFGQFFNIILKHHEEYSEFFASYLGGVALSDYIMEFNNTSTRTDEQQMMEYVCVRWGTTHVFPNEIKNPIYVRTIAEFNGFEYKQNTFGEGGYSLEFTPLNELKKYPFKLISNNIIADMNSAKTLFTLQRDFTVFDVLIAVFNEITFMGNPKERDEALKKLQNRLNESVKNFKDGKAKEISFDDFLKKMKIDPPREE
jgi:hypothetical protein